MQDMVNITRVEGRRYSKYDIITWYINRRGVIL